MSKGRVWTRREEGEREEERSGVDENGDAALRQRGAHRPLQSASRRRRGEMSGGSGQSGGEGRGRFLLVPVIFM